MTIINIIPDFFKGSDAMHDLIDIHRLGLKADTDGLHVRDNVMDIANSRTRPSFTLGHPLTATGFVTTRSFERSPDCYISSYDLDPDVVLTYLNDNPEFVDRFVFNHVKQDRIEKWLQTKHGRRHFEETSNGGSIRRSKRDSISKWKFSPQIDKHLLLRELTEDINQIRSKGIVLNELAACVAAVIDVDGYNIYLVDEETQEICYSNPSSVSNEPSNRMPRWKLGQGSVLSAYVAHSKQAMRLASINDIAVDERFPGGVGTQCSSTVQYVLCLPILQYTGEVLGVVELLRENGRNAFTKEDEELTNSLVVWGAMAVYYVQLYVSLTKQKKMNEFLLTVTRSIFQDIVSIDTVIMKIMNYAKTLVDADRTALFLTDNRTRELYARVFDMGGETEASVAAATHIQKEIRLDMY
ncbi:cAMP and cAMP-inhibited cGMP 3',5'-cyclic phosphodiesterase 10A [Lamellibrachia satsuma]|nr:cAMP and cAMP-inhibited cGMP 3',5'-cyclic phosphodiesterase 10A [Lamellibrachia satsuma]